MQITPTALPDVLLVAPKVFGDERGFFFESWNRRAFAAGGIDVDFVQDNHSRSRRGVLRGLHYQIEHAQGKLVRATEGEVFDVAVDLRRSSPSFGRSVGVCCRRPIVHALGSAGLRPWLVCPVRGSLYKATDYWYRSMSGRCSEHAALRIDWPWVGADDGGQGRRRAAAGGRGRLRLNVPRPTVLLTGAGGQVGSNWREAGEHLQVIARTAPRLISPTPMPSSRSCARPDRN
jgi:dTDP-4-dehydrorhamnose 3,5-epimerase